MIRKDDKEEYMQAKAVLFASKTLLLVNIALTTVPTAEMYCKKYIKFRKKFVKTNKLLLTF